MMMFNVTHGRVGRLFILLGLIFASLTAVFATATLPADANDAPVINTTANLSYTNNDPVLNLYQGDTVAYQVELFSSAPATGVVVTVTVPAGMAYQSNNCGGTEVAVGQFVWPLGSLDFFASCHLMLAVGPTTTGVLTITAETTADVYDLSNSQLTMTNEFVVLAPTSLVIRHTAVASPTLPFTYTVSAPPHALYATRAITASGTGQGQLSAPAATATDAQGNVYVVDGGNYRIQKFDGAGNFLLEWGSNGAANGQFNGVNDIALDSAGNVWVADQNNNRLQKFDGQGNFLQAVGTAGSGNGEFLQPWGLAIAPDDTIYVVDHFNNRIQRLDETGAYLGQWDGTAGGGTQFFIPYRVALAPDGSVYVSDFNGVQKFTAMGTFIAQVGTAGTAAGQLNDPVGLAVDELGNLYVTDTSLGRVQKFSSTGDFLASSGRVGDQLGLLGSRVRGLEWLGDGRLLAASTSNNQLVWFSSAEAFALAHDEQIAYQMSPTGTYTFTATAVAGWTASWQCETTDTAEPPLINGPRLVVDLSAGEQVSCTAVRGLSIYLPFVGRP
jgi:uncharacterized repeat protein (TIGR01451 family)